MSANDREWGHYRDLARDNAMLDGTRERELLSLAKSGDEPATRELVASHMRLVVQVASAYARDGISAHDLVSEGTTGLMEAVRRFDLARDTRFATYAGWWVRACVRQHALANRRIVGMPDTRAARVARARLRSTERALTQELGRHPSRSELASALGISELDIELVESAFSARDVPIVQSGAGSFELPDDTDGPEQAVARAEAQAQRRTRVKDALAALSPRERELVCGHLYTDDGQSLAQLGRAIGVSRQRAGQILSGACKKLRVELACVA